MAEMKYTVNSGRALSISDGDAEKLISLGDGLSCLLYIYIMKNGGAVSEEKAAFDLKKSESDISGALSALIKAGLISCSSVVPETKERPEELPQYTSDDIKRELENGQEFSAVVSEVQGMLGRFLSSGELIKLFGIYDYLGLPGEVIVLLVGHCKTQQEKRYGSGSRLTLRTVEREAYVWERRGIVTLPLAEEYLGRLDELDKKGEPIKRVLGINSRALTATEKKYIDAWAQMDFPIETVELAYDKTVVSTGKLSWGYMHKILTSWRQKGIVTPEEARNEGRAKSTAPKSGAKKQYGSAAPSASPTADDLERMRRFINDMNKQ